MEQTYIDNTALNALKAIVARIHGEWDEPNLMAHGALHVDTEKDILSIAEKAIKEVEGDKDDTDDGLENLGYFWHD